jgi:hypothetical protein
MKNARAKPLAGARFPALLDGYIVLLLCQVFYCAGSSINNKVRYGDHGGGFYGLVSEVALAARA